MGGDNTSVLIKGMEISKKDAESCICTIKTLRDLAYNIHGVMDWIDRDNCRKIIKMLESITEIPTPHGRLIDGDELVRIWTGAKFYGSIKPIVDARPTVIEAEE